MYPYTIKSLTNNTELITITLSSRFGHGVSYSILEELETENAFLKLEKANENGGVILPDGCQQSVFSIVVAENIDRLEETVSGKILRFLSFIMCTFKLHTWSLNDTRGYVFFFFSRCQDL